MIYLNIHLDISTTDKYHITTVCLMEICTKRNLHLEKFAPPTPHPKKGKPIGINDSSVIEITK
jgi:hypothetical protein